MLKKIGLTLSKKEIENIVNMVPDAIEQVLLATKYHLEQRIASKHNFDDDGYSNTTSMQNKENYHHKNQNGAQI